MYKVRIMYSCSWYELYCNVLCAGGPGSRKGCIVDDLVMAYDLKHICTEQLLHSELPKKLAGVTKIENVNGVKEVLEVRNADTHQKLLFVVILCMVSCMFV